MLPDSRVRYRTLATHLLTYGFGMDGEVQNWGQVKPSGVGRGDFFRPCWDSAGCSIDAQRTTCSDRGSRCLRLSPQHVLFWYGQGSGKIDGYHYHKKEGWLGIGAWAAGGTAESHKVTASLTHSAVLLHSCAGFNLSHISFCVCSLNLCAWAC